MSRTKTNSELQVSTAKESTHFITGHLNMTNEIMFNNFKIESGLKI